MDLKNNFKFARLYLDTVSFKQETVGQKCLECGIHYSFHVLVASRNLKSKFVVKR